jgi:hypothetical protein
MDGAAVSEGLYILAAVLLVGACLAAWRRWGLPGVVAVASGAWALVSTVAALLPRRGMDLPDAPTLDRAAGEAAAEREQARRLEAEAARVEEATATDNPEALARAMVARSRGET